MLIIHNAPFASPSARPGLSGPRLYSRRRYLSGLGAAAPTLQTSAPDPTAAVIAQVCPSGITKSPCGFGTDTSEVQALFQSSVASRLLLWPPPSAKWANCTNAPSSTASKVTKIASSGAGMTAGILTAAAVSGPFAPIVAGVGAVLGLVSGIFAHHSQAVALQSSVLCQNVPAANTALQGIDQELAAGAATPQQAAAAYSTLAQGFTASLRSDPSYKKGDGLDAYNTAMQLVIQARLNDLKAGLLTGGAPAPFAGTAAGLATSLGLPPIALWAAAGLAVWFLL
jgi:hypothetical protein